MAAGVSAPYGGYLWLVWALSVASLGLSAALLSKHSGPYPSSEWHGVLIQNVFAWAWNVTILAPASFVLSHNVFFGAASQFLVLFVGFLQAIVGLGSITGLTRKYGYPDHTQLYRAYLGVGWTATFLLLFAALWAGFHYVTGQATAAPPKKDEEVHF
uniref:Uncharacterized protein n=1 Tax=Rhodotorula toruloides TaxID=5286 RepID=A0A0K3CC84_RHOTO